MSLSLPLTVRRCTNDAVSSSHITVLNSCNILKLSIHYLNGWWLKMADLVYWCLNDLYSSLNQVIIASDNGTNSSLFVNLALGNKFHWNLNQNMKVIIWENRKEDVVCTMVAVFWISGTLQWKGHHLAVVSLLEKLQTCKMMVCKHTVTMIMKQAIWIPFASLHK